MEDSKLLWLLRNDPNLGMEQLMNQYTGLVCAVIRSRFSDSLYVSSDIEDCAAEVFSKFYFELDNYKPEAASIKTYLCVMARNSAINLAKKRNRQQGNVTDTESISDDDIPIESDRDEAELRKEVIRAVEKLGAPDSEIIFRKFYYGESSKEIAERLGLTVSNVDTRTHRALNKLRKRFGGKV